MSWLIAAGKTIAAYVTFYFLYSLILCYLLFNKLFNMSDTESESSEETEGNEERVRGCVNAGKGMSSPPLTHGKVQRADSVDLGVGRTEGKEQVRSPGPSGFVVRSTPPT